MDTETNNANETIESLAHEGVGESGPTKMMPAFPIAKLRPAAWNPRKHVDQEALTALAADITARGIIEPLVVRDVERWSSEGPRQRAAARRVA